MEREFRDRAEAGRILAGHLEQFRNEQPVVYALPRGGVATGVEVAEYLQAPLDLVIPRKIGHPMQPEYAICAVGESGFLACNPDAVADLDPEWLGEAAQREQAESARRRSLYMAGMPEVPAEGSTAIIVDDGIATGLTMFAAVMDVRERRPEKIVIAVPVAPRRVAQQLQEFIDAFIAVAAPEFYRGAVGAYYENFGEVDDQEVIRLLQRARASAEARRHG